MTEKNYKKTMCGTKNCLETNLRRKKKAFCKIFCSIQNCLELPSLDDVADFFRIINVYQGFLTLNILFDEVVQGNGK